MKLRDREDWQPLHGSLTLGAWDIGVWVEPRLPGEPTADGWLVAHTTDGVRLGVVDPALTPPELNAVDGVFAGQTTLACMRSYPTLVEAFSQANRRLCRTTRRPKLANTLVSALAVDLGPDVCKMVRAGDVELWVSSGGVWSQRGGLDMLTSQARKDFSGWKRPADESVAWEQYVAMLDDPIKWAVTPLGFVIPARVLTMEFATAGVESIIVASDGAQLTPERCANLQEWLTNGLQGVPTPPHPSPHGDVAVLHARRR